MDGPAQLRNVTVTLDGVTHSGTYYTHGSMVYVQYGGARRNTQTGGLTAESIAMLLLSELVLKNLGLKAKGK
jgi:hypothetical protein